MFLQTLVQLVAGNDSRARRWVAHWSVGRAPRLPGTRRCSSSMHLRSISLLTPYAPTSSRLASSAATDCNGAHQPRRHSRAALRLVTSAGAHRPGPRDQNDCNTVLRHTAGAKRLYELQRLGIFVTCHRSGLVCATSGRLLHRAKQRLLSITECGIVVECVRDKARLAAVKNFPPFKKRDPRTLRQ